MWTSIFKKHYCPVDLNIFTQLWITRRATLVQFLISLRVYLLWAYDGRFGSLLGPFGTGVTLGTLCSHFGHMMGIDASEDPQIGKNTHFPMVFKDFMKTQFICVPHVHVSDVCNISITFIWDIRERYISCIWGVLSADVLYAIGYSVICHMQYAIC